MKITYYKGQGGVFYFPFSDEILTLEKIRVDLYKITWGRGRSGWRIQAIPKFLVTDGMVRLGDL